ncbi:hypothetical protein ABZ341_34470 [Streptomyces sp. NPDC006173]
MQSCLDSLRRWIAAYNASLGCKAHEIPRLEKDTSPSHHNLSGDAGTD